MRNGIYYLNNSGRRWVILENGKRIKVKVLPDQYNGLTEPVIRTAILFESFGNFAVCMVSIKGKRIKTLNYEWIK
jgi:HKD family nuclease